jgi:hypothetical protein
MRSYERAVLETDRIKLPQRIQAAEAAIAFRLMELDNSIELLEAKALRDALLVLQSIVKDERWNVA